MAEGVKEFADGSFVHAGGAVDVVGAGAEGGNGGDEAHGGAGVADVDGCWGLGGVRLRKGGAVYAGDGCGLGGLGGMGGLGRGRNLGAEVVEGGEGVVEVFAFEEVVDCGGAGG